VSVKADDFFRGKERCLEPSSLGCVLGEMPKNARRNVAGVLNFCGLTYGLYCDNGNGHFVKIETCTNCTATTETVISLILKLLI
jgi:hypothetical protein